MTHAIRFLLNGALREVRGVDPHANLLTWLREDARLTGSKEGCAEGDCGACTVLVGEAREGRMVVKPVNACIRLLPSVDGLAVFTIEGLKRADGALHPAQNALIEHHGSQCGFCTPGFTMSMVALYKNKPAPTRAEAVCALSGNLCRCTGYRPILDAACAMQAPQEQGDKLDWLHVRASASGDNASPSAAETALQQQLLSITRQDDFEYEAAGVRFSSPQSVERFSALAAQPGAWILGGGTDIGLWINKGFQRSTQIIHSAHVQGLNEITQHPDGVLEIGAAVPLDDAFAALDARAPEFTAVWTRFASPPVRASGTLGGNVANGSPIGDSMPLLIALGAQVVLMKGAATRTLPLEDLYLAYKTQAREAGEWVRAIRIPKREAGVTLAAYKNSKRNEQDISAVCVGIALTLDGAQVNTIRIAYGGMAGTVKRATYTEAALTGATWNEQSVREATTVLTLDFAPLSDMRASAAYRMQIAQNLLLRFFHETQGVAETAVFA